MDGLLDTLLRRVKSDYQISYVGGSFVRRIERGRRTEWYVDGAPASAETAKQHMATLEARLRRQRP